MSPVASALTTAFFAIYAIYASWQKRQKRQKRQNIGKTPNAVATWPAGGARKWGATKSKDPAIAQPAA